MKRLLAIALALLLCACSTSQSITNPVTRNSLVTAESAYGVVLTAAVSYRSLCANKTLPRDQCAPVVARLQAADLKVQVALRNLRAFVRDNPTVDAISLVNAVRAAVTDFETLAANSGVK